MIYISGYIVINWLTRLYITNIMQFLPRKKEISITTLNILPK